MGKKIMVILLFLVSFFFIMACTAKDTFHFVNFNVAKCMNYDSGSFILTGYSYNEAILDAQVVGIDEGDNITFNGYEIAESGQYSNFYYIRYYINYSIINQFSDACVNSIKYSYKKKVLSTDIGSYKILSISTEQINSEYAHCSNLSEYNGKITFNLSEISSDLTISSVESYNKDVTFLLQIYNENGELTETISKNNNYTIELTYEGVNTSTSIIFFSFSICFEKQGIDFYYRETINESNSGSYIDKINKLLNL